MKRCAIMQPTYLPWSGYFNLIASVDVFVFLDCVQFDRRSWQSRNRILLDGAEHMLSIPIAKMPRETHLNNIKASAHSDWQHAHSETLRRAYKKTSYGPELLHELELIYIQGGDLVVEFNIELIEFFSDYIGLRSAEYILASELGCIGKRSELLANICHEVSCDSYLAPAGSKEYLLADQFEEKSRLELSFQSYNPRSYAQLNTSSFVSHLSIVDVVSCIGPEATKQYCLNGG